MPASSASMSCSLSALICSRNTAIRFSEIFIIRSELCARHMSIIVPGGLSLRISEHADPPHALLCVHHGSQCPPHAAEQGDELAPSHGLLWDEANKLPHHWTMWAPCIAAKYSRLCRFRLMAEAGPSLTRRAVRSTPE